MNDLNWEWQEGESRTACLLSQEFLDPDGGWVTQGTEEGCFYWRVQVERRCLIAFSCRVLWLSRTDSLWVSRRICLNWQNRSRTKVRNNGSWLLSLPVFSGGVTHRSKRSENTESLYIFRRRVQCCQFIYH